jgi:hypothetical protein
MFRKLDQFPSSGQGGKTPSQSLRTIDKVQKLSNSDKYISQLCVS